MSDLRRVSGPPSRIDRHLGQILVIVLIAVLVAVIKPWNAAHDGSQAIVAPTPSPTLTPSPTTPPGPHRYDIVEFGIREPPPTWEIWFAGNLASFQFAMRADLSTPVVARLVAGRVERGRARGFRLRHPGRLADRRDPAREPARLDRRQSAARAYDRGRQPHPRQRRAVAARPPCIRSSASRRGRPISRRSVSGMAANRGDAAVADRHVPSRSLIGPAGTTRSLEIRVDKTRASSSPAAAAPDAATPAAPAPAADPS